MARPKKTCFFVTPISTTDSQERKRADQVQRYILKEVLGPKYKIVRADELPHPGSITHQIISLLHTADLVVADLTGSNANVAYELAIRHAFNKVCIHLIDKEDKIPFDLKDERTIAFDLNDPDSLNECKDELKKFEKVISQGRIPYSSPVFRTLGVAAATDEEKEGFLDEIADTIDSIATDVTSIESTLTMSDIDQIDAIKYGISGLEQNHAELVRRFDETAVTLRKIIEKLNP